MNIQKEEITRQCIHGALDGNSLLEGILIHALRKAENCILAMSETCEIRYPGPNGKRYTLDTLPKATSTSTTMLAVTTFSLLCGQKESYVVTPEDLLNIIAFIKNSSEYTPSRKWPFTKEQIGQAWKNL